MLNDLDDIIFYNLYILFRIYHHRSWHSQFMLGMIYGRLGMIRCLKLTLQQKWYMSTDTFAYTDINYCR